MLGLCVAATAFAQSPQPGVTPFPLEFKRKPSGFSGKEAEELQRDFVRLVRKSGAMVPDSASLELAIKQLKRQDCERADECLQQLALQGQTLYSLYASVEYTLEGAVVATGRVVRDDGKVASPAQIVTLPKGRDPFKDVARVALVRLLEQLGVGKLSPFRPVEAAKPPTTDEPKKEPEIKKVEPVPTPPPIVIHEGPPPMRVAGWVLLGAGVVATGVGAAVFATTDLPRVDSMGNVFAEDVQKVKPAQTQQAVGVGLMSAGGAMAVAGVVLWVVSLSPTGAPPPVKPALVPVNGGAVAVLGGTF